jgi:hypothetical protein
MRRARSLHVLLLVAAVVPLAGACGDADDHGAGSSREAASDATRSADRTPPAGDDRTSSGPCAPLVGRQAGTSSIDADDGRALLGAATARSTRSGHRFVTDLRIDARTIRLTGTLVGRRAPDGTSRARLTWTGLAALVAPDLDVRIVDDVIQLRPAGSEDSFSNAGSASGIALDVGRELLDHPQLLVARSATRSADGNDTLVTLAAPAPALRTYATRERRGLATDLLRSARSLEITSTVRRGRLVGDRFVLRARLPAGTPLERIAADTPITITGTTRYCPLP